MPGEIPGHRLARAAVQAAVPADQMALAVLVDRPRATVVAQAVAATAAAQPAVTVRVLQQEQQAEIIRGLPVLPALEDRVVPQMAAPERLGLVAAVAHAEPLPVVLVALVVLGRILILHTVAVVAAVAGRLMERPARPLGSVAAVVYMAAAVVAAARRL